MNQALTDAAVRSAIEATHGSIFFAAQTLGATREEFLEYGADWPCLAALVDDYRDRLLDDAHSSCTPRPPSSCKEEVQAGAVAIFLM